MKPTFNTTELGLSIQRIERERYIFGTNLSNGISATLTHSSGGETLEEGIPFEGNIKEFYGDTTRVEVVCSGKLCMRFRLIQDILYSFFVISHHTPLATRQ